VVKRGRANRWRVIFSADTFQLNWPKTAPTLDLFHGYKFAMEPSVRIPPLQRAVC
jgi:hypothetical protein